MKQQAPQRVWSQQILAHSQKSKQEVQLLSSKAQEVQLLSTKAQLGRQRRAHSLQLKHLTAAAKPKSLDCWNSPLEQEGELPPVAAVAQMVTEAPAGPAGPAVLAVAVPTKVEVEEA
jgi:hypothetical protein